MHLPQSKFLRIFSLSKPSKLPTWETLSSKCLKKDTLNWWGCSIQVSPTSMVLLDPKLRSTKFNYPLKNFHKLETHIWSIKITISTMNNVMSSTLIFVPNPFWLIQFLVFLLHSLLGLYVWIFVWFTIRWIMFSLQEEELKHHS